MNETKIYHALRARELCAAALAKTVAWDPLGAVCSWAADVYGKVDSIASNTIIDADDLGDEIFAQIQSARDPVTIPYRDGSKDIHAAWSAVIEALAMIDSPESDEARACIREILEDHVDAN